MDQILLSPSLVAGQTSSQVANVHISLAAQLISKQKWAEARAEYEAAFALAPVAVTMSSIAFCLEQEGKLVLAGAAYRRALAIASSNRDASLERDILPKLVDVLARTPKLIVTVHGAPSGLAFSLNGKVVHISGGELVIEVDAGIHEVTATAYGFADWKRTITVRAGERISIEIKLEPYSFLPLSAPMLFPPTQSGASIRLNLPPQNKVDRTLSSIAFTAAGALGVAGTVLAVHTGTRVTTLDGCNTVASSERAGCWGWSRGAIQGEGTAMWIIFAMSGAIAVTGAVLYWGVEGRKNKVKVSFEPRIRGAALNLVIRY